MHGKANMTPDELKRLDARCRIARRDAVMSGNPLPETLFWNIVTKTYRERSNDHDMLFESEYYALADDVKPTPKTVEVEGWMSKKGECLAIKQPNGYDYDIAGWAPVSAVITFKPTPKTEPMKPREWDAWVDKFGDIWSLDEVEEAKEEEYINKFNLKPIRVREVIDTPKEPKERREYQGWVHDGDGDMVEVLDWEIVMRGFDPVKVGYRLATLVEKGGGE